MLRRELRQISEQLECLWIRQRVDILHDPTVYDVAHGELCDLSADRPRDIRDLNDLLRHVMRARVDANLRTNALLELLVERLTFNEANEQHDPDVGAGAGLDVLSDHDTLENLRKLIDLSVDLGRPDANAAGIQRCVAPTVDDHSAMRSELGPVTVAPRVRIRLEVRGAILGAVGIVPERNGHARKRCSAHELSRSLY